MNAQDFLVEIGTEELPPKALKTLRDAFSGSIVAALKAKGLEFGTSHGFAAPRRLALHIEALPLQTPITSAEMWGPPAKIAFDKDGKPSKAGLAFASKNNLNPEQLQTRNDGKVDKLFAQVSQGGELVAELLPAMVTQALADLPIPKRMRWGAKRVEFVRPVHWLVMLLGSDVVEGEVMGLSAGRHTRGHRFHFNQRIELAHATEYSSKLKAPGFVMVDFAARQQLIVEQVNGLAKTLGGNAVMDANLLDEVTALVEWPVALAGNFEQRFLEVPAEALISSMGEHQKYFHLVDSEGNLMPHFITVANIESKDPAQVIDGNERVIRPRLSDAAFFFETDKKVSLLTQRERLKNIVFQAQLGTLFEKTERVAGLAKQLAEKLNGNAAFAHRAGLLCKSDLVTNMVGEFDTMQGVAGYYYALNDGEDPEVAAALNEQYLPRFAGDALPETATGTVLALADRIDTLVGIFAVGMQPTGSKDPFALRRASLGALRLLVEKNLPLDLAQILELGLAQHQPLPAGKDAVANVTAYMLERFRAWYADAGFNPEIFMAVSAKQLTQPLDIDNRVKAVNAFSLLPQAQALAEANKRVANILAKLEQAPSSVVDQSLLQLEAEKTLAQNIAAQRSVVEPLFAQSRYAEALTALASLQPSVDAFFDGVMVMDDDLALRNNRLALLSQLRALFLEVADISLLVPAKG